MFKVHKLSSGQFIALGYIIVIVTGSLLLSLPFSTKNGYTSFIDAFFTATSATCVTGLVLFDTFTHWTTFGQIVILLMIQIGGIGFMTIITIFAMVIRKKIGLYERKIIMLTSGNVKISGSITLIKRIVIGTAIFETFGAILLSTRFCPQMGLSRGIYFAIFHSISAFCNAGFDLMGAFSQFGSFTMYSSDVIVNLTLMFLIFMGGIGFVVWNDFIECKFNIKKLNLHSKIVLSASAVIIIISTVLFYIFEKDNLFVHMSTGDAILASLFQSITTRTAGFNTINISELSNGSTLLSMILMFIGGNSGSTAGGIKVTTFLVVLLGSFASIRNTQSIVINKKKLEAETYRQAIAIFISYLTLIILGTLIISGVESFPFKAILFEVISALGTVGLSMGITTALSAISKIIIILLMYAGRVGIITISLAFTKREIKPQVERPVEKILIG
jgi:trk system potassium uptake protein TrkH